MMATPPAVVVDLELEDDKPLNIALSGRLKQGDLWAAMRQRGWDQKQLGEYLGMGQVQVGKLLNMRWIPKKPTEELKRKLFDLTLKLYEELWPEWAQSKDFLDADKRVDVYLDVTARMLADRGVLQLPPSPDEIFDRDEMKTILENALDTITPREAGVIKMRYGIEPHEEMTYQEIGNVLGVTSMRIRQIHAKALRKLRHPSRCRRLYPYIDA